MCPTIIRKVKSRDASTAWGSSFMLLQAVQLLQTLKKSMCKTMVCAMAASQTFRGPWSTDLVQTSPILPGGGLFSIKEVQLSRLYTSVS